MHGDWLWILFQNLSLFSSLNVGFGGQSTNPFGQSQAPMGGQSAAPAFGQSPSPFGATAGQNNSTVFGNVSFCCIYVLW